MKFIKKLQRLPEKNKIIIIWSIIIIFGLIFSVWRIGALVSNMKALGEVDLQKRTGIEMSQEEAGEMKKGIDMLKETTDATKEGFQIIKELMNEIKKAEDLEEVFYDNFEFLIDDNN